MERSRFLQAYKKNQANFGNEGENFANAYGPRRARRTTNYGMQNPIMNAAGGGLQEKRLNNFARNFTFKISTTVTTASGTVRLFNANLDPSDTYNASNNVTVVVQETDDNTQKPIKAALGSQAYRIIDGQYIVSNASQLSNTWKVVRKTPFGESHELPFQPQLRKTALDNQSLIADLTDFATVIDQFTYIQFTVNAAESITVSVTMSEVTDVANTLRNADVVEQNSTPTPMEIARGGAFRW